MFILYKIQYYLCLPAASYTVSLERALRDALFSKYLYKITKHGICVRIKSIEILDNFILRKEAELLVKVAMEIVVFRVEIGYYYEGVVTGITYGGIIVAFGGILKGIITHDKLHDGSLYNEGKWMLPFTGDQAFTWGMGDIVRVKIAHVDWTKLGSEYIEYMIKLRADEQGLGPTVWWV